ncbi:MAG: 3-methyl-2-oxobutanoate dehydrogenase subunit VorB [Candidatus Gastranaerophilales bacterium]|nr:3-methyl-2-oxobutanoate dehydrogenase subunit VorB [Candidatus Gastranaerophilales bacterium]
MNKKELLKGNIAIARAALDCGCSCYFGYPITPQTEIGEYLSTEMQKRNLAYVCAESEIGAINMALGAASTGEKVMVSSSSCAVALMQETLSYAASDELPIVLVNVMRAGPGQGYIYPSQGDYNQATIGGGNGDYKTIVLSPANIQECADMTQKAFYLSQKYRIPTILLLDGLLGQMAEPVIIKENPYPEIDNSSWNLSGAKNRSSRKIHSLEPNPEKLYEHIKNLHNKHIQIENNEVDWEEYLCDDADYIITAFGSLGRIAKSACDYYRLNGHKFGVFRPKTLYPFPAKKLRTLSQQTKIIFDAEMNLGQMYKDVQNSISPNAKLHFIGKPAGEWIKKEEIIEKINKILQGQYATSI